MELFLADLCEYSDTAFSALRRRVDACAVLGHSYELPCVLPADCAPQRAALCFWNDGGRYQVYVRPRIAYRGQIEELSRLLAPPSQSYPDFSAATRQLRDLSRALRAEPSSCPPVPHLCRQLEAALALQVIGQEQAAKAAAYRLYTHLTKRAPTRPLSMILHGPTGVGKSELAKSIPRVLRHLFPSDNWQTVWTDLNTYTQPHSVSRLLGSPPGYIGYDDTPVLEAVRHAPRTVFIFDELEKAHPEVLKLFMSILDEGRCTARRADEQGNWELDFRRCVFLFTTNLDLSSRTSQPMGFSAGQPSDPPFSDDDALSLPQRLFLQDDMGRRALVRSGVLREIAGRFSSVIGFHPLDLSSRRAITAKQIAALGLEYGIHVASIAPELVAALTPDQVFSVRSEVSILEGILTPFFARCRADATATLFHLSGTPEHPKLTPLSL